MIYLDNNATTRPLPAVVDAIVKGFETAWGNPSSPHCVGQQAARAVTDAREKTGKLLSVAPESIVFTSGATEANDAVLRHHLRRGHILFTSDTEHPAINGVYRRQAEECIRTVPVDRNGQWDLDALEEGLTGPDFLIALAWANGETGVLQDVERICTLARAHGASVLIDASQAVGRIPIQASTLGTTYLTFSGHKVHAPKGTGGLVQLGAGDALVMVQAGGDQEAGRRGGTENVPGLIGLGAAFDQRHRDLDAAMAYLAGLRNQFEALLLDRVPAARLNGVDAPRVPNTSNVTFPGIDGMALVARLMDRGILCSQVSACSSGKPEASPTLVAMGHSPEDAFASVRFAFAVDNSLPEVEVTIEALGVEVEFLRHMMGGQV